jgi:hypothetical protein
MGAEAKGRLKISGFGWGVHSVGLGVCGNWAAAGSHVTGFLVSTGVVEGHRALAVGACV